MWISDVTPLPDIPQAMTRKEALALVRRMLTEAGFASAALDARLLISHALGVTLTELLARDEVAVGPAAAMITADLARRLTGESVARIVGEREFWGLPFQLSADTLEPRPDTETLIEAVCVAFPDRQAPLRILDLGTGTGCIIIALLSEFTNATGIGVDVSNGALATATANAKLNGVCARIGFVQSDWFKNVSGTFDIIVSNPPYIRSDVVTTLEREVRDHDPTRALDGGADGLDAYRRILTDCPPHLSANSIIFFEIGFDQKADIEKLAHEAGFSQISFKNDLAGHARVAVLMRGSK